MKRQKSLRYIRFIVFIICTILYLNTSYLAYCQNNDLFYFQEVGDINMIPTCMLQDRDGFIWIGTRAGLVKYNGDTFKFIKSGPGSISGNHIVSMLEDGEGLIWLGINGTGVDKFDKGSGEITVYSYTGDRADGLLGAPSQYLLQSLLDDNRGGIWIGSLKGLSCFNKTDDTFKNYQHDDYNTNSLLYNEVFSIFKDSRGYIWIGYDISEKKQTEVLDFSRLNPGTGEFRHYDLVDNSYTEFFIKAITEDPKGNLWIAFRNTLDSIVTHYLVKFDPATGKAEEHFKNHGDSAEIYSRNIYQLAFFPDYAEYLFINHDTYDNPTTVQINLNTEKHLFYNKDTVNAYGEQNPGFRYILQDIAEVLLGIDPYGKLFKSEPLFATFQVLKANPKVVGSIPSHKVIRMIEDRDSPHIIWMGTLDQGLIKWDRKEDSFFQYPSLPGDIKTLPSKYIIGLADNGMGKIIIGGLSQQGKLSVLDKKTNTILKYIDLSGINYILPDTKDTNKVWCTGVYFGLTMVDLQNERYSIFSHKENQSTGISSDLSYWVIQDLDNEKYLWIATAEGVNRFDKQTYEFKSYLHDPDDSQSIPDMKINSIMDNGDGTLWVCTAGGLAHFDKQSGKSRVYNKQTGFPTDFIYTVQPYNNILWIQSDIGIIKFNVQDPENTKVYDDKYGVTSFIYQAALKTHDNLIFFSGSLDGPTYF